MQYVPREAGARLRRLLREFPTVLVYGPRQSGKSTLVQAECPGFRHLDLERPADVGLGRGFVVYGGDEPRRVGGGIELLPWRAVARGEIAAALAQPREVALFAARQCVSSSASVPRSSDALSS